MKKIPSVFCRNYVGDKMVRDEVVLGSEWVFLPEAIPTRKWDGTACLILHGDLYKRYDAKNGKTPPEGFIPAQDPDPITGHHPGWIPCRRPDPADRWHWEAFDTVSSKPDGTYEVCGPKIQGNPEGLAVHTLIQHGAVILVEAMNCRDFVSIREYLKTACIEGIVWHHPDGRMAKIKTKDFGLSR